MRMSLYGARDACRRADHRRGRCDRDRLAACWTSYRIPRAAARKKPWANLLSSQLALPDWNYPTGGGPGLVGMLQAFAEMEASAGSPQVRPQMSRCRPKARADYSGLDNGAETPVLVWGQLPHRCWLGVPRAIADS